MGGGGVLIWFEQRDFVEYFGYLSEIEKGYGQGVRSKLQSKGDILGLR